MNMIHSQPEIRRWAHPIEVKQRPGQCDAIQTILCSLAGQNQVLCAIKAELDEIYALLQDGCWEGSGCRAPGCGCDADCGCEQDDDCDCDCDT